MDDVEAAVTTAMIERHAKSRDGARQSLLSPYGLRCPTCPLVDG